LEPEYYNKEIKRLKAKVRKAYNKRKFGDHYTEQMKQLSKQPLAAKKPAQEARSVNAGPSFINTYEGVKEIGRLSLPSRTVKVGSSQIRYKIPTRLIYIIQHYSAARAYPVCSIY
jgi:hypothetical protein